MAKSEPTHYQVRWHSVNESTAPWLNRWMKRLSSSSVIMLMVEVATTLLPCVLGVPAFRHSFSSLSHACTHRSYLAIFSLPPQGGSHLRASAVLASNARRGLTFSSRPPLASRSTAASERWFMPTFLDRGQGKPCDRVPLHPWGPSSSTPPLPSPSEGHLPHTLLSESILHFTGATP